MTIWIVYTKREYYENCELHFNKAFLKEEDAVTYIRVAEQEYGIMGMSYAEVEVRDY